jgi:hypothetical protein
MTDAQVLSLGNSIGMSIDNFAQYHDGFSFTVETELEAYKAAYKYQGCKKVVVKYAPNVYLWSVQIYTA